MPSTACNQDSGAHARRADDTAASGMKKIEEIATLCRGHDKCRLAESNKAEIGGL